MSGVGIDIDPHLSYNYVTNRILRRLTQLGILLLEKGGRMGLR